MFSHLSPEKPHKCVLKPSEQDSFFQDNQFEGSHAQVYSKNEHFPMYLLKNPINVCYNPQNKVDFLGHSFWGDTCLGLLENECFPIYLLRNPINVCWNPQNRARFSEMIDLRGHIPRFTLKMNNFPSISLEIPKMFVETHRTGLVFLTQSIWGAICLDLFKKWTISLLSP